MAQRAPTTKTTPESDDTMTGARGELCPTVPKRYASITSCPSCGTIVILFHAVVWVARLVRSGIVAQQRGGNVSVVIEYHAISCSTSARLQVEALRGSISPTSGIKCNWGNPSELKCLPISAASFTSSMHAINESS